MLKWELKEKFDVQDEKYREIKLRHDRIVEDAEQKVKDLISKKERTLREEFESGEDKSAERATLIVQIEEAQKELAEVREMRVAAYHYATSKAQDGRITVRDLTVDWNTNYVPAVVEKELMPIIERMSKARDEYYNSLVDYCELLQEYSPLYDDTRERENKDDRYGDKIGVREIANAVELPLVVDYSRWLLREVYRNELLRELKGGRK